MEMQAVDVDDVPRLLKRAVNVAVFPDTVPNSIRTGFFVENAVVGESLLGFDDRFERLVLHLNEFSGIVGEARRLGNYGGNRLTLVKDFARGHGEVTDFLRVVRTDFDEGLRLLGNFFSSYCAHYPGQRFGGGGTYTDHTPVPIRRPHKAGADHFARFESRGKLAP